MWRMVGRICEVYMVYLYYCVSLLYFSTEIQVLKEVIWQAAWEISASKAHQVDLVNLRLALASSFSAACRLRLFPLVLSENQGAQELTLAIYLDRLAEDTATYLVVHTVDCLHHLVMSTIGFASHLKADLWGLNCFRLLRNMEAQSSSEGPREYVGSPFDAPAIAIAPGMRWLCLLQIIDSSWNAMSLRIADCRLWITILSSTATNSRACKRTMEWYSNV